MRNELTVVFAILASCAASRPPATVGACSLTPADVAAVRGVVSTYRDAWMAADRAAVLALFTEDAVLLPHHGDDPVVGHAAMERFWWPPGSPPFTLTRMAVTVDEAGGDCAIAFQRGTRQIARTSPGRTYQQRGTYLNVLRQLDDGTLPSPP